jgi:hypothetical protein
MKLTIELVPSSAWNQSLYNLMARNEWNKLKSAVFAIEGRKCFICGESIGMMSLHEFWSYDETTYVQKLMEFHHLCNKCHKIKHIGFWCHTSDGLLKLSQENLSREDLIKHFCAVNGCSKEAFDKHERDAFSTFRQRSQHYWKQDFGECGKYIKT